MTGEDDLPSEVHKDIVIERRDMKTPMKKLTTFLCCKWCLKQRNIRKQVIAVYTDVFVLLCFIIWPRNLDNLLNINYIYFAQMYHPAELQLNKNNTSD